MESSRRFIVGGSLSGKELQRALEEALAEEGLDEATVRAEREKDELGTAATLIVLWVGKETAKKVFGKAFDELWDRLVGAVRRRFGDDALVPAALPAAAMVDGSTEAATGAPLESAPVEVPTGDLSRSD